MHEEVKSSGSTREFATGAHRDNASGKGRTDLLPLLEVSEIMDDNVIKEFGLFVETHNKTHLINAIINSIDTLDKFHYETICRELNDIGIEIKLPESDGDEGKNTHMKIACLSHMMLEASKLYEAGAIKYGANNWKRGMPVSVYLDSGIRHYLKTLRGDTDEPHYRGFIWNTLCAMWTIDNISNPFDGLNTIE